MNQIWRNAGRLSSAFRQCKSLQVAQSISTLISRRVNPIASSFWGQSHSQIHTHLKYENLFSIKSFSTCSRPNQSSASTEPEKSAEAVEDNYVPSPLAKEVFELMKLKTKEEITEDFFMMNRFRLYRMWKEPVKVKEYLQSKNILSEDEIKRFERQEDSHDKFYEMYFRFEDQQDYTELLIGLDRAGKNDEFFKFFKKWLKPEEEHIL